MATALYVLGCAILIGGLAWAAVLLGAPGSWILAGVVVLAAIAILSIAGGSARRGRRPPPPGGS